MQDLSGAGKLKGMRWLSQPQAGHLVETATEVHGAELYSRVLGASCWLVTVSRSPFINARLLKSCQIFKTGGKRWIQTIDGCRAVLFETLELLYKNQVSCIM